MSTRMVNDAMRYRVISRFIDEMGSEDQISCSDLKEAIRICNDVLAIDGMNDEFTIISEIEGMISQQVY